MSTSKVFLGIMSIGMVIALGQLIAQADGEKPAETPKEVPRLIEQLGSSQFAERQEAARKLAQRDDALPALKKALGSPDPEVRRQAEQIIEEIQARAVRKRVQRIPVRVNNGEVDRFVEQMVTLEEWVGPKEWQAVLDLVEKMVDRANKQHAAKLSVPDVNKNRARWVRYPRDPDKLVPDKAIVDRRFAAAEVTDRLTINRCVIVSQGRVHVQASFDVNIVFANGDVHITAPPGIRGCIVVADGRVKTNEIVESIVISNGPIEVGEAENSVLIAGTVKVKGRKRDCIVIENAQEPLGLLKFYDTRQSGVEVAEGTDGVVVRKVLGGQPFAKAGFQEGDQVLAADGKNIGSPEEFRKCLRSATVTGKEVVLRVQRAAKTIDIPVLLDE